MGITLFNFKTKEQREAEEAAVYQTALKNFNDFISQHRSLIEMEEESSHSHEHSNFRGEDAHLLAPVHEKPQAKILPVDLETLRDDINEAIKKYDFLRPIVARAFDAVSEAIQHPNRQTKRELFFAQLAVSRPGDASRGISRAVGLISLSFIVIAIALVIVIGSSSLFLPGFFLCLGIILAVVAGSRKIAISPKDEINDRDAIADTMASIRKAL